MEKYRDWINTLLLGVVAVALVVGGVLFAGTLPAPAAQGQVGAESLPGGASLAPNGIFFGRGSSHGELLTTGVVALPAGSVSAPAYSFWNDTDSGVYEIGANNPALAAGGTKALDCTATVCTSDVVLATGTFLKMVPATAITVTNGAAFTPTGSYQGIQATGNVTPTVTAGFPAGTVLRLVNVSNTSILIQDSGTMMLTGDLTLGQYDSLALISDGTNWIEVATSNN